MLLLSRVEQEPLHDLLQPNAPQSLFEALSVPDKVAALQDPIKSFRCPSDTGGAMNDDRHLEPGGLNIAVTKTNYIGCMGVDNTSPADGLFYFNSRLGFRGVTDGLSHTFALGERATRPIQGNAKPAAGIWAGATSFPCNTNLPNDCTVGFYGNVSFEIQTGRGLGTVTANGATWGYSSPHPGGVPFAMADGSVKFIADSIEWRIGNMNDPTTWGTYQRLGARNDGQEIGKF